MSEKDMEIDRLTVIANKLSDMLNEKIDECEELKSEVARLESLVMSMELSPAWNEFE